MQTYHEYTEREVREEKFRDDLEQRYRDDPAFWRWYEAQRKARITRERDGNDDK